MPLKNFHYSLFLSKKNQFAKNAHHKKFQLQYCRKSSMQKFCHYVFILDLFQVVSFKQKESKKK